MGQEGFVWKRNGKQSPPLPQLRLPYCAGHVDALAVPSAPPSAPSEAASPAHPEQLGDPLLGRGRETGLLGRHRHPVLTSCCAYSSAPAAFPNSVYFVVQCKTPGGLFTK